MRIKRERESSEESSEEEEREKRYPSRIKQEPSSDNDEEHSESQQPTRKKFKRIKEIKDSDSSSSSEEEDEQDDESESGIVSNEDEESEKSEDLSSSSSSKKTPPPSPISKHLRSKDSKKKVSKAKPINLKRKARQRKQSTSSSSSSSDQEESDSSSSSSTKGNIEFESSSSDVEEGPEKSCSSSSGSEIDEDESIRCCIACRNLGNTNVKGRSRINGTPWCKCGHCKIIGRMTDYDRVCCRELKDVVVFLDDEMEDASKKNLCITEHPRFKMDVIKQQALKRTGYSRTAFYGNDDNYQSAWAFVRWIWNRLGYGTRMIIPSCVAAKIKETNKSTYFKSYCAVITCETGKHCKASQHQ